jgi:hypothetical protein
MNRRIIARTPIIGNHQPRGFDRVHHIVLH